MSEVHGVDKSGRLLDVLAGEVARLFSVGLRLGDGGHFRTHAELWCVTPCESHRQTGAGVSVLDDNVRANGWDRPVAHEVAGMKVERRAHRFDGFIDLTDRVPGGFRNGRQSVVRYVVQVLLDESSLDLIVAGQGVELEQQTLHRVARSDANRIELLNVPKGFLKHLRRNHRAQALTDFLQRDA